MRGGAGGVPQDHLAPTLRPKTRSELPRNGERPGRSQDPGEGGFAEALSDARADRLDAAARWLVVVGVTSALLLLAIPTALALRARPTPERDGLEPLLLTYAPLRPAGRPADARSAPGDPPIPGAIDLLLPAPVGP